MFCMWSLLIFALKKTKKSWLIDYVDSLVLEDNSTITWWCVHKASQVGFYAAQNFGCLFVCLFKKLSWGDGIRARVVLEPYSLSTSLTLNQSLWDQISRTFVLG